MSTKSNQRWTVCDGRSLMTVLVLVLAVWVGGCTTHKYRRLRGEGQRAMLQQMYWPARHFFVECDRLRPRQVENLHDLGNCCVLLARERFERQEHAAAMREADAAIDYYSQALEIHPGHQPSLQGKNNALELKGQFDEALAHAEWAAEFVGPSAKQYLFLASEREERGDADGALLAYRQAIAVEPGSAEAHIGFAKFLLKHRREREAVYHLQAAYRLDPLNEWVVDQLAARSALPPLRHRKTSGS